MQYYAREKTFKTMQLKFSEGETYEVTYDKNIMYMLDRLAVNN